MCVLIIIFIIIIIIIIIISLAYFVNNQMTRNPVDSAGAVEHHLLH